MPTLETGKRLALIERGEQIDTVEVVRTGFDDVVVKSVDLNPDSETTFGIVGHFQGSPEWKVLHEGLGGERCISQRAPTYTFAEPPE